MKGFDANSTRRLSQRFSDLRGRLGPGLLFAAAAVGTSHLVQATRAGAGFGLTLITLIVIVCVLKYPLFRFAADYAAVTGESLVAGYARRGRWLVVVMFVTSAIEAIAATAGVALVTASLVRWLFQLSFPVVSIAMGLLALTALLVSVGRYRLLESLTGVFVVGFTVLTLIATFASLGHLVTNDVLPAGVFQVNRENVSFAIAVSGWMPIGNTASIMLAAWVLAKVGKASAIGSQQLINNTRFDFNLGYITSLLLAVCFLVMGAAILYGQSQSLPTASAAFTTAFVGMYAQAVGEWSEKLVLITAIAVMYSTLLAITDGFPRMISQFISALGWIANENPPTRTSYLWSMAAVIGSACCLLIFLLDSFTAFIDLVTITGFLAAPLVAFANQLALSGDNVPLANRPGIWLKRWNLLAIVTLSVATGGFLYLRVIG